MATLLSWPTFGIGDLDVFMPSPPCLVVYTSYEDGNPESSVTYLWQDERTGALHHELVYQQAVPFETAVAWAQEHAPTRNVERIHVKHARAKKAVERKPKAGTAAKRGPAKKAAAKKDDAGKAGRGGQGPKAQGIVGRSSNRAIRFEDRRAVRCVEAPR